MKLTSLYCKWPRYNENQFNEKFRNKIEKEILNIHQNFLEGLTDEELGEILRIKLGLKTIDTNLYRPRRADLSKERISKVTGNVLRHSFLKDSGKTRLNKHNTHCIVWVLEPQNLSSWMD